MQLSLAQKLIEKGLNFANDNAIAIAIAVVDTHGELVAFVRQDECGLPSGILAQSKAYTAAREKQPSGNLGQWAQKTGKDIGYWNDAKITGFAGGVPVMNNNIVIGGLGISGLSEEEDEQLAKLILSSI